MFREMFLVTGLAKVREKDAAAVDAMEVLKMACVTGAKCMVLDQSTGLAEGNLADMILLDLRQPNMQPLNHIAKNIVYSGSKQNVVMTMINGKVLYEKGVFYLKDGCAPADVYKRIDEITGRLGIVVSE
jgi:5-methylthioadenosine/S-adenosylhomocysteine deaminase